MFLLPLAIERPIEYFQNNERQGHDGRIDGTASVVVSFQDLILYLIDTSLGVRSC